MGREAAHERELHSAMQMSQSCEDLTIMSGMTSCKVQILHFSMCLTFVKISVCLKLVMIIICGSDSSDSGYNHYTMTLPDMYQCARETCFLHHRSSTLMTEVAGPYETSVPVYHTSCHNGSHISSFYQMYYINT